MLHDLFGFPLREESALVRDHILPREDPPQVHQGRRPVSPGPGEQVEDILVSLTRAADPA